MSMKRRLASLLLLLLASSAAFGQVHITQPFKYSWDEPTPNVTGVAGAQQVQHFEVKVDAGTATTVAPTGGVASTIAGQTTFKLQADPALPLGTHSFVVSACSSSSSGVG